MASANRLSRFRVGSRNSCFFFFPPCFFPTLLGAIIYTIIIIIMAFFSSSPPTRACFVNNGRFLNPVMTVLCQIVFLSAERAPRCFFSLGRSLPNPLVSGFCHAACFQRATQRDCPRNVSSECQGFSEACLFSIGFGIEFCGQHGHLFRCSSWMLTFPRFSVRFLLCVRCDGGTASACPLPPSAPCCECRCLLPRGLLARAAIFLCRFVFPSSLSSVAPGSKT